MSEENRDLTASELEDISGGASGWSPNSGPRKRTFRCRDCKNLWSEVTDGEMPICPKCGSTKVGYPAGGFSGPRSH